MDRDYFSNFSFLCPKEAPVEIWVTLAQWGSEKKSFEILNNFPIQMYGVHTNEQGVKLDLAEKRSGAPSQMICAKIQPQCILGFGGPFPMISAKIRP